MGRDEEIHVASLTRASQAQNEKEFEAKEKN